MIKKSVPVGKQEEIVKHVSTCYTEYKELLSLYHQRLLNVYIEISSFTWKKTAPRDTAFKVNKAHEIVNKVLPRVISRNPKWIVSAKPDSIVNAFAEGWDAADLETAAEVVQKILTFVFEKYGLTEQVRMRAKDLIIYGKGIAKAWFKYRVWKTVKKGKKEEVFANWDEETVEEYSMSTEDYVWDETPCIENISRANIFYDPRYKDFDDLPAVIEIKEWVRLSQLKSNKEYINIDKLEQLPPASSFSDNTYMDEIRRITGISNVELKEWVDKNNLTVKEYYGYYDYGTGESLYKFTTVSDLILICIEEITQIPYEQVRAFEDTESNLAYWFVEPIISLTREMNFKKNSASQYINQSLNRSYFWNPNSSVNPRDLISRPNAVIPVTKDMATVQENLREMPQREINSSHFNEQNDFERQIQAMTFTVDTSSPNSQQSLTNTATGARIKFFESNTVMDEIRKHLEEWLSRLWYKLLSEIYENMEENDNIIIGGDKEKEYLQVHKEVIKDALKKYDIKIETWSSSYDTIETRRDDAIAKFNLWLQAMQAWVNIDTEKLWKDIMGTFETSDPEWYIKKPAPQMPWMPAMPWQEQWWWSPLAMPEWAWMPWWAAELTQSVAQGNIMSWVQ